jgi:CelD/BcsL family acetyltransferase involved in cellulose biosynthesis
MHDGSGWTSNSPYTVEVISTEEGVAALEKDWNRLSACAESPNVFMTYSWFSVWLRRLMSDDGRGRLQPHMLLIKQNEVVVGIVPLVRRIASRPGFHLRKLGFPTYHSDYNDLVLGNDVLALTRAAMDYLRCSARDWDLIDLTELRDDGSRIAAMEAAAADAGLQHRLFPETDECPYMPIDLPWSETWEKRNLNFAQRAFRGIEARAGEGFHVRAVDHPEKETGLLERIVTVEAQKRIGGRILAPFIGRYTAEFQSLFATLGPQGLITMLLMEKNEELVAYLILFRCGKKLWDYQTGYDRAYSVLSPGTALICGAIDYGFNHGCDEFDFLRGMDEYKFRWTSSFHRNRRMILWNSRFVSKLYAALYLRYRVPVLQEDRSSG